MLFFLCFQLLLGLSVANGGPVFATGLFLIQHSRPVERKDKPSNQERIENRKWKDNININFVLSFLWEVDGHPSFSPIGYFRFEGF